MDWITENIAIGDYREAQDVAILRSGGIRSVLGLVGTLAGKTPGEMDLDRIEILTLLDGPGNDLKRLDRAVQVLQDLVDNAPPVFVHCRAGWSRSPAVVAGYLMKSRGISAEEAIKLVAEKREFTMVPELRQLLEQLVGHEND